MPIGDWSILMILSRCSSPSIRSCSPGWVCARFKSSSQRLVKDFDHQSGFSRTGYPGDADQTSQRDVARRCSSGCSRARQRRSGVLPLPLRRFSGIGTLSRPERYAPVSDSGALRISSTVLRRPPARHARRPAVPGRQSNPPKGWSRSSCSTTSTVLPRSRSPLSVLQQAGIVARVQANRRLIQHVQHAHQA